MSIILITRCSKKNSGLKEALTDNSIAWSELEASDQALKVHWWERHVSEQFDNLLNPIAGDSPCGDGHVYSRQLRESFSKLRKPEKPDNEEDTSYRRTPDWLSVVKLSESALSEHTKDIRVVCHLIEAWTQIRGFDGLRDGLALLTEFLETCWERSNPPIADGDLEVRTLPLENMLDDTDRGICFPITIRQIKLLGDEVHNCDFLTHQKLHQSTEAQDRKLLEQIVEATDSESFSGRADSLQSAIDQLGLLKISLEEKFGDQAPGLINLRNSLIDCQRLVKSYLPKIILPQEPATDQLPVQAFEESDSQENGNPSKVESTVLENATEEHGKLRTRSDAYRQLSEAAEFLRKTEPHSPIPYLVNRAVDLGKLQFPMLVQQLVREEGILGELRREFGIDESNEEVG